ncbi:CxC2 domain-containing protein [Mycena kentingensis (nom. inval.)]|nr:CxC2 domain-containing protein [Mycena kentingensis (nom. inval.)]
MDSPRTCTAFSCLDQFQILSLHGKTNGKTNAYDYYAALETQTNAIGVKPPDRYKVFLRVTQQWRHLHLLKRAGRGHDKYGVNLPQDWRLAAPEDRCLYTFVVAIDACFRLKRRIISSWIKDPGLGTGWAYMLEPGPYEEYLATVGDQKELCLPLSCIGLATVDHANDKFSRGYAAMGVGMGVCAWHEFIIPNGVGDLQRGKRYANMDWIFTSFMRHFVTLLWLIISYDIACQWHKNLKARLAALPPLMRLQAIQAIIALARFAIPKMHIKGHILLCQLFFAFGLIMGSGQVDGEGIERPWSMLGGIAASTRASGPGSHADQLDDHLGFWNWLKLIRLGALLRRRLNKARIKLATQETEFTDFCKEQANDVESWKERRDVRNQFEEEEAQNESAGVRVRIHDVGPAEFLSTLLRVEDEQCRVHTLASLKRAKTSAVKINLRKQRRHLNKSINRIQTLQAVYTPSALQYLSSLHLSQDTPAEEVPLLPPSSLTEAQRSSGGCYDGLDALERQFRDAQCRSALVALRNQLHIKSHLLTYKKRHSRHQGANTRSRALVARNENKILLRADKYQAACCALVALAGGNSSSVSWPALLKEHIRCMDDSDEPFVPPEDRPDVFGDQAATTRPSRVAASGRARQGETRRVMSWIWKLTARAGSDEEFRESVRIEWCKAYARTRRWREEVRILEEEWRRFPLSMAFEERRWADRAASLDTASMNVEDAEGLLAYAAKQTDVFRGIARRAEAARTAPAYRRGVRRVRESAMEGVMEMPESMEVGGVGVR